MNRSATHPRFKATLLRPAKPDGDAPWAFILLPKEVSETLPRRGRTTVTGTLNGHPFQATLDPDGQLSHWLKVDQALQSAAAIQPGDTLTVELAPVAEEPEPEVPADLQAALDSAPEAQTVWQETTPLARLDWIHWVTSAKQPKWNAPEV